MLFHILLMVLDVSDGPFDRLNFLSERACFLMYTHTLDGLSSLLRFSLIMNFEFSNVLLDLLIMLG